MEGDSWFLNQPDIQLSFFGATKNSLREKTPQRFSTKITLLRGIPALLRDIILKNLENDLSLMVPNGIFFCKYTWVPNMSFHMFLETFDFSSFTIDVSSIFGFMDHESIMASQPTPMWGTPMTNKALIGVY